MYGQCCTMDNTMSLDLLIKNYINLEKEKCMLFTTDLYHIRERKIYVL